METTNTNNMALVRLDLRDKFFIYLMQYVGKPYIYAGNCPAFGADCSGAVIEWLKFLGINTGRDMSAQELFIWATGQQGSRSGTGVGALAFYGNTRSNITHVALMIDSHRVIEFGGGDSTTTTEAEAIRRGACCRVRDVGHRQDLVAVVRLKALPWLSMENYTRSN